MVYFCLFFRWLLEYRPCGASCARAPRLQVSCKGASGATTVAKEPGSTTELFGLPKWIFTKKMRNLFAGWLQLLLVCLGRPAVALRLSNAKFEHQLSSYPNNLTILCCHTQASTLEHSSWGVKKVWISTFTTLNLHVKRRAANHANLIWHSSKQEDLGVSKSSLYYCHSNVCDRSTSSFPTPTTR